MFRSLRCLSGELCACFVVHCDCRWNRCSVQQSIIIVGGFSEHA
jgi:hypothetical protein